MFMWERMLGFDIDGALEGALDTLADNPIVNVLDKASAINDFAEGARTSRFMNAGLGMKDAAKLGGTGLSGPLDFLAPIGLMTGLNDLVNGDTWQEQTGGGLDAIAGGAGLLELFGMEAAGPVGLVAGAGATGWKIGTHGNSMAEKYGFAGTNEDGSHKSLSQAWGDVAFNPMTAGNAGPALVAAGGAALISTMADPFLELAGIDAPISPKQQREMNGQSKTTYDAMHASGMSDEAAMHIASLSNPEFRENRERMASHSALVKSGLPPIVAHMLTGVTQ
jgi:hypothetical protein